VREKECSRGGVWVCMCKPGLKKVLLALIRRSNLKMEYTVKSSFYTVYIFFKVFPFLEQGHGTIFFSQQFSSHRK